MSLKGFVTGISLIIPYDTRSEPIRALRRIKPKRSIIDKILGSELAQSVIPEIHMSDLGDDGVYRKMNFCGPFTDLKKRLDIRNGRVVGIKTPPINDLDAACMRHDIAYMMNRDPQMWRDADVSLVRDADYIRDTKKGVQSATAKLVGDIIRWKSDLKLKRNVL